MFQSLTHFFETRVIPSSPFCRVSDTGYEQAKINIFRIATALIVLYQLILTAHASFYYFDPASMAGISMPPQFLAAVGMCVLTGCMAAGLFTPAAILTLLLLFIPFCNYLHILHLGTAVFHMLLVLFLLTNAGGKFSLDALILKRPDCALHPMVRKLYGILKFPQAPEIGIIYYLVFGIYALVSLAALLHHFTDVFWTSGLTIRLMFVNAFLSKYYGLFRELEQIAPGILSALSVSGLLFQSVFQLAMLPLLHTRLGQTFVIAWGLVFFLLSALFLQLSYLAYMELVLWGILFIPARFFSRFSSPSLLHSGRPVRLTGAVIGLILIATLGFLSNFTIYFQGRYWNRQIASLVQHFGFTYPNVFNIRDLSTGNLWFVIRRHPPGRQEEAEVVPFNGPDGNRLVYQSSDVMLYGPGLMWRVGALISGDPARFSTPGQYGFSWIARVIQYDYRMQGYHEPVTYRVDVYGNKTLPFTEPYPLERYRGRHITSMAFTLTGNKEQ